MRILVVGVGALGGYFGGRLLDAGRDVTFLVRPHRARQLTNTGLIIRSARGDVGIRNPPLVQANELRNTFDLVLLSCKAYDLDATIDSIAPAVGPHTTILPLLNGMRHLDVLDAKFGAAASLGGQCFISAALDAEGRIQHFNDAHSLSFGERSGSLTPRAGAIRDALSGAGFDLSLSESILQEMWEKWIFIAAMAGVNCLMRASIGDLIAAGGAAIADSMLNECGQIASSAGFPPRDAAVTRYRTVLTATGSPLIASMLRDIERGARTEGEHIIGDLVRRQLDAAQGVSLLRLAHLHLQSYEIRRARELEAGKGS
jgi:2-dehydropantoate 2-reductase